MWSHCDQTVKICAFIFLLSILMTLFFYDQKAHDTQYKFVEKNEHSKTQNNVPA